MRSTMADSLLAGALLTTLALGACSTPAVTREIDGRGTIVRAGPIDIGFFRHMELIAHVEPAARVSDELGLGPKPPETVTAAFPGLPFDRVHFRIDGRKRTHHRPLFEESIVMLTRADLVELASASFVSGVFDDGWGEFTISLADQELIRRFAVEIGALPP